MAKAAPVLPPFYSKAALAASKTSGDLPFLLGRKCFFSVESRTCPGPRRAKAWSPWRRRAFAEAPKSRFRCAYPRRQEGSQRKSGLAVLEENGLPLWSLFGNKLSRFNASDFPLGEISFVMTAGDVLASPEEEKDDATDADAKPTRGAEATELLQRRPDASPDPAVATSVSCLMDASLKSEETRAQWLLGTFRADAAGLAAAVGDDKKSLIALFRATALHRLTRQRWLLKPLKAKIIQNIESFHVDEIACLARAMHQVGYLRTDFLYAASTAIAKNAQVASPASCCLLLEAFAAHRLQSEQAVRALCGQLRHHAIRGLAPPQLASVISSLARLNVRNAQLLATASSRLLCLWSNPCAASESGREAPAPLGRADGLARPTRATKPERRFFPHDVAQVIYGLTKLQCNHPLMAFVLRDILPQVVGRMHSHQLTITAVAIQRLREHSRAVDCKSGGTWPSDARTAAEPHVSGERMRGVDCPGGTEKQRTLELLQDSAFGLVVNEVAKRLPQFKAEVRQSAAESTQFSVRSTVS